MSDRTPFEERRIGFAYYLGMTLTSCLDRRKITFLAHYGYDVESHLRDLLSFIENELATLVHDGEEDE